MIFPNFRDSEIPIIDRPFFTILRSSLWQTPVDTSAWPEVVDWEPIIDAFEAHALLGVVAHTILSLPKDKGVSSPQLQDRILTHVGQVIKQRHKTRKIICDIFTKFEEAGINPILLKGEGLASFYPNTCHRAIGDIDIYVGEENIDKAKEIINKEASPEEVSEALAEEATHHYHITINGYVYEIHRYPGEVGNPSYANQYRELSAQKLKSEQSTNIAITTQTSSYPIRIPSLYYNVWYVFNHLVAHMRGSGVGLRQFCDWALVIKQANLQSQPEYLEELKIILHTTGLIRAWKILSGILVHQFGLSPSDIPFYDSKMAEKSQGYILDEIVYGQNFRFRSNDKQIKELPHGIHRIICATKSAYLCSRPLSVVSITLPIRVFWKNSIVGIRALVERKLSIFRLIK